MAVQHRIRHWRGTIESYNFLKSHNALDDWTLYYVIYSGETAGSGGTIVEYFGQNRIHEEPGQLLPVESIVSAAPLNPNPYDRYLVGEDINGYEVYEYTPEKIQGDTGYTLACRQLKFDEKYGVRVKDMDLKNYIYVNGRLVTYDDVDCGDF